MIGAVGHFTLQPMARTNHKFPGYWGPGQQNPMVFLYLMLSIRPLVSQYNIVSPHGMLETMPSQC